MPTGRPGDPNSDDDWFVTDWIDTTRAEEALHFQHHSWPDLMAELAEKYRLLHYPGPSPRWCDCSWRDDLPIECAGPVRRPMGCNSRQIG